jgi:hypothetical protein
MTNAGLGCATNLHGITTIVETNSASEWTTTITIAHPGETFTYSGGPVTAPSGPYQHQTTANWTNIACP